MFLGKKSIAIAAAAAASLACAAYAPAQTVVFNTSGSSAQWQTYALAAAELANKGTGYTVHRYSIKGNAPDAKPFASIVDSRAYEGKTPPPEAGNLWVVWNETSNGTVDDIYAFTSVDSVIGLRAFFAVPRAKLGLDIGITETTAGGQLISASLPEWGTEDKAIPMAVYNVLNSATLTAANTDIRPEDGLFAYNRAVATLNTTTYAGLGYGPGPIGTGIVSHYTATAIATPVAFSLSGADPITGDGHTGSYITIPVGASPIVFAANKTNASGLGKSGFNHDISVTESTNQALIAFTTCNLHSTVINPIIREPLSGTMNTTEFTNFRISSGTNANPNGSQEEGINPAAANSNPLDLACTNGGHRTRAVGTGDEINNGVLTVADAVGYSFFGYGNFSKLAAPAAPLTAADFGYYTLDGVDPIAATYSNGEFTVCPPAGCPIAGGASFPNLRNGKYRSWSLLRVVTDTDSTNPTNYTNTLALTQAADKLINKTVPDFVPFLASCSSSGANEPGLDVYRSHFTQSGVTGVNGSIPSSINCPAHSGQGAQTLKGLTLGGGTEAGGDVGGQIQGPFTEAAPPTEPGVLNKRD